MPNEHYEKYKETIKANRRRYYWNNREQELRASLIMKQQHPERYASYSRSWYNKVRADRVRFLTLIYSRLCSRSRARGYSMPRFNEGTFIKRYVLDPVFMALHAKWVAGGFQKHMAPSFDRIDCHKPYRFSNMQVITWGENESKGRLEHSIPVVQLTLDGKFVAEYRSSSWAARDLGFHMSGITKCCRKTKHYFTYKGFLWMYKSDYEKEKANGKE